MKRRPFLGAALLAILAAIAIQGPLTAAPSGSILVGAELSLSGGLDQWCRYIQKGIELAIREDSQQLVQVKYEDDKSLNQKAVINGAHKLIDIDKVDLLYSWTASAIPQLIPLAKQTSTPLLIGAYDARVRKGAPYAFGAFVNYDLVPREIARFLISQHHASRIALITIADDWSQGFEGPFIDEVKKLGAELVLHETVSPSEGDLSSLVLRLKNSGADGVLAPLFSNSLYSFLKRAHEQRFQGVIHVGDGMFEEDIKLIGAPAEGVFSSQIWIENSEFLKLYKAVYQEEANPLQLGLVATGYDWIKHLQGLAQDLKQRNVALNRASLAEALKNFESNGFSGHQNYGKGPEKSGEVTVVVRNGRYQIPQ